MVSARPLKPLEAFMASNAHHREQERADLKGRLMTGASILMLAPRRIGKTWLLGKIAEDMRAEGWLCIEIDVEGMQGEDQFLRALCAEIEKTQDLTKRLWAHLSVRLKQLTGNSETRDLKEAATKVDPRGFLETLVEALDQESVKTLLLIDEIALFVLERVRQDPDGARSLLYHLRKLQQAHRNVVWFLTGSVGLDVVARRYELQGTMLGYDTFPLLPFSEEAAHAYLEDLNAQRVVPRPFKFGDGAFNLLANELGWLSPYYLRQIALAVRPTGGDAGSSRQFATYADISAAIEQLLSPTSRLHFSAWEEHIKKNFEKDETNLLRALLDAACDAPAGETEGTLLTRLQDQGLTMKPRLLKDSLLVLQVDGYLEKVGDHWRFRSGLLRRYWKEYAK
jgi:uncharacterized protein